ncbi:MAG: hypothetical protein LBU15_02015, partial [Rickettsiales bacterium]|nr:hypothetical protein [Rickettsiales bacterium]
MEEKEKEKDQEPNSVHRSPEINSPGSQEEGHGSSSQQQDSPRLSNEQNFPKNIDLEEKEPRKVNPLSKTSHPGSQEEGHGSSSQQQDSPRLSNEQNFPENIDFFSFPNKTGDSYISTAKFESGDSYMPSLADFGLKEFPLAIGLGTEDDSDHSFSKYFLGDFSTAIPSVNNYFNIDPKFDLDLQSTTDTKELFSKKSPPDSSTTDASLGGRNSYGFNSSKPASHSSNSSKFDLPPSQQLHISSELSDFLSP